jgi:hypothetical protein
MGRELPFLVAFNRPPLLSRVRVNPRNSKQRLAADETTPSNSSAARQARKNVAENVPRLSFW